MIKTKLRTIATMSTKLRKLSVDEFITEGAAVRLLSSIVRIFNKGFSYSSEEFTAERGSTVELETLSETKRVMNSTMIKVHLL
jgi:hypothetical protein